MLKPFIIFRENDTDYMLADYSQELAARNSVFKEYYFWAELTDEENKKILSGDYIVTAPNKKLVFKKRDSVIILRRDLLHRLEDNYSNPSKSGIKFQGEFYDIGFELRSRLRERIDIAKSNGVKTDTIMLGDKQVTLKVDQLIAILQKITEASVLNYENYKRDLRLIGEATSLEALNSIDVDKGWVLCEIGEDGIKQHITPKVDGTPDDSSELVEAIKRDFTELADGEQLFREESV